MTGETEVSQAETAGVKPKKCTKCGEPVKGHIGATGKNCQAVNDSNSSDLAAKPEETMTRGEVPIDYTRMLPALVSQISSLNMNMEAMLAQQAQLIKTIEGTKATTAQTIPDMTKPPQTTLPVRLQSERRVPVTAQAIGNHDPEHLQTGLEDVDGTSFNTGIPTIPVRTKKSIQSGEFINLSDLLNSDTIGNEETEAVLVDGKLQFRPKKARKTIDNFKTWLSAWNNYEIMLIDSNPNVYKKCVEYRKFIQLCDQKYVWHAIAAYDVRFRAKLALENSLEFDQIDTNLYVSILDATAVKSGQKTCHRCKSYDHLVNNCPFPAEYTLAEEKEKKSKRKISTEKWFFENKEGCNNFQTGNCTFPGCKRAHVCKRCRGPEPAYRCKCGQYFQ